MDIWQWVGERQKSLRADGHDALAQMVVDMPSFSVDEKFDRVEQIFQQAIPLCRDLGDKWLEIYFRHWRLQTHVLKNYDAKGLLPEAIALLDFSHAEDTQKCPQRICAVQDLASCYGIKDGPGFSDERVAVCKEALAQIDGSWPCYECVSAELIDALLDAERFDEAKAEFAEAEEKITRDDFAKDSALVLIKTRYFLATQDYDAAWEMIKDARNILAGENFVKTQRLLKTLVLCRKGEWSAALENAPRYEDIVKASTHYKDWAEIQSLCVESGRVENTRILRAQFHDLIENLAQKDARRVAFTVSAQLLDLCYAAGERFRAKIILETMAALKSGFNKDLGAQDILDDYNARFNAIAAPKVEASEFKTPKDLGAHVFATEDAEITALQNGRKAWPENIDILTRLCALYDGCHRPDMGFDLLAVSYGSQESCGQLESAYGAAFLKKHGYEKYANSFSMDTLEGLSRSAIWNRGFTHIGNIESHDPKKALAVAETIETHWPEDPWLMGRIAKMHLKQDDAARALIYYQRQVAAQPEEQDPKWDVLVTASILDDKDLICEMAAKLTMKVNENGRYGADHYEYMRLQTYQDGVLDEILSAYRIGPVLARVVSFSNPHAAVQTHGQEIVFDPSPLNNLDQEDDSGSRHDKDGYYNHLYPTIKTVLDPKYQSFTLDGVQPADEDLARLRKILADNDVIFNQRSNETYRLNDLEALAALKAGGDENKTDKTPDVTGLYAYILVGESASLQSLHALLSAFNETIKHPLVWPKLAEALGDVEVLKKQLEISETYGIMDD